MINDYIQWLTCEIAQLLEVQVEAVMPEVPLLEVGIDSVVAIRLSGILSDALDVEIDPMVLFDYPTIAGLSEYLYEHFGELEHNNHTIVSNQDAA